MIIKGHTYYIFGIFAIVMFTISVIILMLMLPMQSSVAKGTIKSYDSTSKSKYTFEATRAISSEPLKNSILLLVKI